MSLKNAYLAVALMSGLSLAACSNTAAGVKKDAEINADKAAAAADKAEDKAEPAAREAAAETREAAREASAETREAAREGGAALKAAVETIDVKSALMADRTVDASHINVDTFHETKTVVLKGSVKSATQRDEAARIAAAEAPGYRIDNQLTVVPNP
ncbi:MAG TPA: BON domain-containing protein [Vicinamibacterales bacterium]